MNYKHLGKYHYIYRLTFSAKGVANVEKFPIVYSNRCYVYVKQAGSDELTKLGLDTKYIREINTEFNEYVIDKIIKRASESFAHHYSSPNWWFLLDDNKELIEWAKNVKLDFTENYILEELKRLDKKEADLCLSLNSVRGQIKEYQRKLAYYRANKEINE